jgi:hypothetical protein
MNSIDNGPALVYVHRVPGTGGPTARSGAGYLQPGGLAPIGRNSVMRRTGIGITVGAALVIIALAAVLPISGCGKTAKVNRMMVGRWVSPEREAVTNPDESVYYVIRDYTFTDDAFRAVTSVYGDPVSDIKFYTATVDGTYELIGESKTVEGATDIKFTFAQITIEPDSLAFIDIFMKSKCGDGMWGLGMPQDVSKTGCLSFRPIADYPMEYDIVKVQGDSLQFGIRPPDGDLGSADRRPAKLSVKALMRQSEE